MNLNGAVGAGGTLLPGKDAVIVDRDRQGRAGIVGFLHGGLNNLVLCGDVVELAAGPGDLFQAA